MANTESDKTFIARKKKKNNAFAEYFKNFGLKQICDFIMLAGMIVLFTGLFTNEIVIAVGMGLIIVASGIAIFKSVRVLLTKNINKRSPEYKRALINTVIMGVIFVLAVFGFIYSLLYA